MPTLYDVKPAFQRCLRPACARLAAAGVTANQVTWAALVLSAAAGGAVAWQPGAGWPLLLFPLVLLVRMALNAIDGMLAREHGMASRAGAMLNELSDPLADAALYLSLALVPGIAAAPVAAVVVLGAIGELAGVVGQVLGAGRRYDGPLGKSDRALAFGAVALLLGLGLAPGRWLDVVLWAMALLAALTVLNRARAGVRGGAR
ncbi:MAG: CDP-alcohol phosphatidyltransferase family protein [Rhodospirillales bacterium]